MRNRLFSLAITLSFNVVALSLIISVVLYRTDYISAQDNTEENPPVLVPRSTQIAEGDDDDGDDDGADDPPTDNDGYDTPVLTDDNSAGGAQTFTFTVRPGDTLSHIALYLGVPLETLAAQTDNPSLIFPDTTGNYTDNDGTDSDGYDTTGNYTDNDGTDSDGYDTPPPSADSADSDSDNSDYNDS